jgi:hypothetical protein
MSLEDPNVLAGLATDGAPFFSAAGVGGDGDDPNVTPMPHSHNNNNNSNRDLRHGVGKAGARGHRSNTLPPAPTPGREAAEAEWWNMYVRRTPGTGGGGGGAADPALGGGGGDGGAGRRPRVASLPSSKTPTALPERFIHNNNNNSSSSNSAGHGERKSHVGGTTAHGKEDLRSYEAAVRARGAPMALSLRLPRGRRGETGGGKREGKGKSASAGASPLVPSLAYAAGVGGDGEASRPGSASSSSLANVFGGVRPASSASVSVSSMAAPASSHGPHVTFAPMDVTTGGASPPLYAQPQYRASPGGLGSASSRESSVDAGSGGSEVGGGEALRPSFKRLPSQTLGPASAKRALLSREEEEEEEGEEEGAIKSYREKGFSLGFGIGGGGGGAGESGLAERRRRRVSAPSGTSPTADTFVGAGQGLA